MMSFLIFNNVKWKSVNVGCLTLKFDVWHQSFYFEVEILCCWISSESLKLNLKMTFAVDVEICIWRLELMFNADLKLKFGVDSESNVRGWHLKLISEVKLWSWSLKFKGWIWNLKLRLSIDSKCTVKDWRWSLECCFCSN